MKQSRIDLNEARIFVKVVEFKSFSQAALAMDIPKSKVSRAIRKLEKDLGLALILRTTRHLSLTKPAELFYSDCNKLIKEFEEAVDKIVYFKTGSEGSLRVTAPLDLGVTLVNKLVIKYRELHPRVKIDLHYSDEVADLVRDGYDLALRVGVPKDSQLKMKKMAETSSVIVATPDYWQKNGSPQSFEDLAQMTYLHFSRLNQDKKLKFFSSKETSFKTSKNFYKITQKPSLSLNHLESLKEVVLSHQGFSALPDFFVKSEIEKGQLVQVLKNYKTEPFVIYWAMPEHKEKSELAQRFREFMTEKLKPFL